jgi:cell division protein FtsI/penicillin-binding protein 2
MYRARALLAATLAAALAGGCSSVATPAPSRAEPVAKRFLAAWAAGRLPEAAALTDAAATAEEGLTAFGAAVGVPPDLAVGGTEVLGATATTSYRLSWPVTGVEQAWEYDSSLTLTRDGAHWRVHWDPRLVHPQWRTGDRVEATRELPARAPLLDRTGTPLFRRSATVTVGVEPRRVRNLGTLAASLGRVLAADGVIAAEVRADVGRARPDQFVPVVTLRRGSYEAARPRIHALPGTVFRTGSRILPVDPDFAQPLLGRVGEPTAEVLAEAGPAYRAGDELGTSGLQRALNSTLAGRPAFHLSTVDSTGATVAELASIPAVPGRSVRTTVDPAVQRAAGRALAALPGNAAIVAVRPSTGALLAVAQTRAVPYDIALAGRYPAGSTFKIVTATALLGEGVVTPGATVACPATVSVGGKTFQNSGRFDLGPVPLRTAFARSCNTTFTSLAPMLSADALQRTAAAYGIGTTWTLPVPSFPGSVPDPRDDVERAADAIGQGRVEVSPLALALVAATVVRGRVPAPVLVDGAAAVPGTGTTGVPGGGASTEPGAAPDVPAAALPTVRDLTRAVVTEGTARALRRYAGLAGKTGTAEYGSATPPRAHSWFVGYRGDLAFAVFVADGASSGRPAVPVAGRFLAALG